MSQIVGQKHKHVLDRSRVVQCGLCGTSHSVEEIDRQRGRCANTDCGAFLCAFCGCSEEAPCLDDNGLPCSWKEPGMCDLCWFQIAATEYAAVLGQDLPPFKEPRRPNLV